ncbi:MAG: thioredoxin family protein [Lentisphaeria bacterium]
MKFNLYTIVLPIFMIFAATGCNEKQSNASKGTPSSPTQTVQPLKLTITESIIPDAKGARLGYWTTDLDAASKLAASQKAPIMLFFTGSDWSKFCQKMKDDVLSKQEWKSWAQKKLVLVYLDFPKNTSKMSKEIIARNDNLQKKFNIESFPTFVLLDSKGKYMSPVPLEEENTPLSFIRNIKFILFNSQENIQKVIQSLPAIDNDAIQLKDTMAKLKQTQQTLDKTIEDFQKKQQELGNELQKNGQAAQQMLIKIALKKASPEDQETYEKTKKRYIETQNDFQNWLKSGPAQTPENSLIYAKFISNIQHLKNTMNDIIIP